MWISKTLLRHLIPASAQQPSALLTEIASQIRQEVCSTTKRLERTPIRLLQAEERASFEKVLWFSSFSLGGNLLENVHIRNINLI